MSQHETALQVRELNHVALHVRDLEASVHFYGAILGLPVLPRPDFDFPGAWFAFGSQELHLIADPSRPAAAPQAVFHFALQVEDAAAASVLLIERGITPLRGPAPRPDGAVQVFITDPDEFLIEIVSYPAGMA